MIVRLMRAIERLPDMRGRFADLADDCGFSSHAHMSAAFQGTLGVSPKQIARRSRAEIRSAMELLARSLREG